MSNMEGMPEGRQDGPARSRFAVIKDRIHWPASLAATGLAIVAVNAYIYGKNHEEGSLPDEVQDFLTIEDNYTYLVETGRTYRTETDKSISSEPIDNTRGRSKYDLKSGAQVWAEEFDKDPRAGEFVDPNEMDEVLRDLKKLAKSGADIVSVEVTGFASAEDDAEDGGLTALSPKNSKLAQHRAEITVRELRQLIEGNKVLKGAARRTTYETNDPIEQKLTNKEADKVEQRAKRSGFNDAKEMVEAWNRDPQSVKKSDRKHLNKLLGNERKVSVNVLWKKDGENVYQEDVSCTTYNITNIKTEEKEGHTDYPLPMPLFVPIPRLRRRRPESKERIIARKTALAGEKIIFRWAGRGIVTFGIAAVTLINVSGENCKGDDHLPRPWPIDLFWQHIDQERGHGADARSTFSLGIPFWEDAQLKIGDVSGNYLAIDAEKPCRPEPDSPGDVSGKSPKCSMVDIAQINGNEVNRKVIHEAPPFKSRTVRAPQP